MNTRNLQRRIVSAGILCIFISVASFAQSPADQIAAEINRSRQLANSLELSEDAAKRYTDLSDTAESYLKSGYLLLSLYQLQLIQLSLLADQYRLSKSELQKKGIDAFEEDWRGLGAQLSEKQRRVSYKQSSRLPAAVKAMIESALTQIQPYYVSGRLYALNTTIDNGLFYLGRSMACADFALFAQRLEFKESSRPLPLRSLATELAKLEAEVVHSFGQPEAASQQGPHIQTNVTLKMAQELDKEKRLYGALHQYLAASRIFGALQLTKQLPSIEEMKSESEKIHARLSSGNLDHSIGLLYWQIAQSSIDRAVEATDEEENLKRAAVIFKYVMPRYFDYINGVKK